MECNLSPNLLADLLACFLEGIQASTPWKDGSDTFVGKQKARKNSKLKAVSHENSAIFKENLKADTG